MLLVVGTILPIAFAFYVFVIRPGVYPAWVKIATITLLSTGLGWSVLDWVMLHWDGFHLTRGTYDRLHGFRGLLGGVSLGIALTVSLYSKSKKHQP
jgi:hypothetical protein